MRTVALMLHYRHVISQDFISDSLKNKKHWNSFNPKHGESWTTVPLYAVRLKSSDGAMPPGFFLHLDDVLDWVEHKTLKEVTQAFPFYPAVLRPPLTSSPCHSTIDRSRATRNSSQSLSSVTTATRPLRRSPS